MGFPGRCGDARPDAPPLVRLDDVVPSAPAAWELAHIARRDGISMSRAAAAILEECLVDDPEDRS